MSPQPQAAVGAPLSRVDGRLKVTGQARYAAEHDVEGTVHAVIVDASIGRGRITAIDPHKAEAQPGVLRVIHHGNAPRLPYKENKASNNPPGARLRVFQDDKVRFHGQPVAVVVATSLEAAQHAASLVDVEYDAEQPTTELGQGKPDKPTTYARGDVDAGLRTADVRLDLTYRLARVRRVLGVYDAGRIISPKLAESQAFGGMVGGIGQALLEHTVTDHRDGRIVNADLADYLVPVNADVPDLRAIYLDGEDREADPLGVKGLGEVVMVGVAPAIANAVFNATGRRIRRLPITAESLL
ncbi:MULTISPECIES: molybdopterin cofactor-binding domain-containing protein [Streptomyces]|uniref:CO/xanthine dehydrogenase Mo-binding subunit n=2 Tax=Streptomyces TaxID=1883 RepID=A0ABT9LAY7_STRGD|nr:MULTISPECIES: molybdopterin cofactor-binding domain-containing protein [Streptomyces]MDP9679701.1 CO/xanthine dehydrogenase Mo-binding subunit [Streptomyces griseoviridis]GGS99329.1 hypothetical protein GCM10010240_35740 [Streptomyces griseoviridis]GGU23375.1 hypothetical protein GCM10010259_12060 [Streptomyces daghestanicus]GHI29972.1 hypothetical protein Sdagh_17020 [Streptomyces daghestanicus]